MVSKLESEHPYALVSTKRSHWDTMPLFYSVHVPPQEPAAHGCPKQYTSSEKVQITTQDSYPSSNTLFGVTFVLEPTPKSDRNRDPKIGRNPIRKSSHLCSKLMQSDPTIR
ncbi:unnamed protein product [Prunus armeniaca]